MKTIKRSLQLRVGEHPRAFSALYRLKRERRAVRPDTQLVIEGFPRSANTFAVWAFRQAQREEVRLAHHLHLPAQVVHAARWGVPTVVLLRRPEDAIVSWVIKDAQPVDYALRRYVSFYETVVEYSDAYVLGHFEEVTNDYGSVIERVNRKFGTRFPVFRHTAESVEAVFRRIEQLHMKQNKGKIVETGIARPSNAKREAKHKVELDLREPKHGALLCKAKSLYDRLVFSEPPEQLETGR